MSLLTYEDARPYAAAIKRRTSIRSKQGTMPPWYIEKDIGIQHYKNDISLSDEEVAKIAWWADNGAPRGNPADMPPPLNFAVGRRMDDWHAGPRRQDATGQRESASSRTGGVRPASRIPASPEDRYVSAIEIKEVNDQQGKAAAANTVGGLFIFHHAIMAVEAPGARAVARGSAAGRCTKSAATPTSSIPTPESCCAPALASDSRTSTCTRTGRTRPATSRSPSSSIPRATRRSSSSG